MLRGFNLVDNLPQTEGEASRSTTIYIAYDGGERV